MINLNPREHPDAALIEEARMAASTEWEEEFCARIVDLTRRRPDVELSVAQRETLERISEGRE